MIVRLMSFPVRPGHRVGVAIMKIIPTIVDWGSAWAKGQAEKIVQKQQQG